MGDNKEVDENIEETEDVYAQDDIDTGRTEFVVSNVEDELKPK